MTTYWENKYLIVDLVFFPPRFFGVGIYFFLIAPFPDRCLLVPLYTKYRSTKLACSFRYNTYHLFFFLKRMRFLNNWPLVFYDIREL